MFKKFCKIFSYVHRNEKGQVMAFIAIIALALVFLWAMVVNIGTLERERVRMQNAVDAAALTAAVWQARGYNILGMIQYGMMIWPFVDTDLKGAVNALLDLEKRIYDSFGYAVPYAAALSVALANGADMLYPYRWATWTSPPPGTCPPPDSPGRWVRGLSLDLVEHKGWILYWKRIDLIVITFWIPAVWEKSNTGAGWFNNGRVWYAQGCGWAEATGPDDTLRFVATKTYRPPIGGFFGLEPKTIRTIAEAKVYLNTETGMPYYGGGFPPRGGLWSFFPVSRWSTFEAKLVPVTRTGYGVFLH